VYHGFLRAANGAITTFDAPGVGTGDGQGTTAVSLNAYGTIVGYYADASNAYHGFVRAASGTIATIDAPGAGAGTYQGTLTYSIDAAGTIAGFYIDSSTVSHGFVRAASGAIIAFEAPGAGSGLDRARAAPASTILGLSRDGTLTQTERITASC